MHWPYSNPDLNKLKEGERTEIFIVSSGFKPLNFKVMYYLATHSNTEIHTEK